MDMNVVGWFEIPVTDMGRAVKFYETVFGQKLIEFPMEGFKMFCFPMEPGSGKPGASGALVQHPMYKPSADGVAIYFSSPSGDLANELSRVDSAGGKALMEKTFISDDIGYYAFFLDSEGNRVALHSKK